MSLTSFYVVCYELYYVFKIVCLCEFVYKFVYVHCVKLIDYVQSYSHSTLCRPWIVHSFCDLETDGVQNRVC